MLIMPRRCRVFQLEMRDKCMHTDTLRMLPKCGEAN